MGQDVVVVKNGRRLCGTGAAVAVSRNETRIFLKTNIQI